MSPVISTQRLELIPATPDLLAAALEAPAALEAALNARVPPSWPPEFLDPPALEFTRDRLAETPGDGTWWMYFIVLPAGRNERVLIGTAGYKGPPAADGTVEIGYGIVTEHQRRGYASEAARGLVARAFREAGVRRVIAETLPELAPSIGVLRKCGFELIGEGSEPGVIRFELTRAGYDRKDTMEPQVAPLHAMLELNTDLLLNCLDGLSDEEALQRLERGGNTIAFLAAHLTDTRHFLANRLGHPLANPLQRYLAEASSIEDIVEWPTLAEQREWWRTVSRHLCEVVARRTAEELRRAGGHRFPIEDPTEVGLIAFLAQHDSYHIGQVAFIRRQLGKPAMSYTRGTRSDVR
jgi:[ribosomal protein S5]-alanine N-acetyltransferase